MSKLRRDHLPPKIRVKAATTSTIETHDVCLCFPLASFRTWAAAIHEVTTGPLDPELREPKGLLLNTQSPKTLNRGRCSAVLRTVVKAAVFVGQAQGIRRGVLRV